jgi:hypothetical protein
MRSEDGHDDEGKRDRGTGAGQIVIERQRQIVTRAECVCAGRAGDERKRRREE